MINGVAEVVGILHSSCQVLLLAVCCIYATELWYTTCI